MAKAAEVKYLTIHGHWRAYVKEGTGPALLLLHGLGCDHTTWQPVIQALSRRYTVIAPDLLGHGLSDKPRADYSVGELAAAAGISVANASQHLRRLETGGILGRRRTGNTVHYRVVETSIEQLCAIVCASVAERARVLVPAD